jgi:ectoine hydroxylase
VTNDLDRDGFVVVPAALIPELLTRVLEVVDRVYAEERAAGRLAADGSLHLLGAIAREDALLELLDLPASFPLVCDALGWNIHMYHSHLDVHPPVPARQVPWTWHQDGGRQNLELETDPRPRLSVKVAFFLSDVSEPRRGNLMVVPGSHRRNVLDGRDNGAQPTDAMPVLAEAGTAVIFDRRLWHARSDNRSEIVRKAIFLGYTYRWIRPREDLGLAPLRLDRCSPVRRQLLGAAASETGHWLPTDDDVPLRAELELAGSL